MEFRKYFVDAVAYWERKRLLYNGVLAVLAIICWGPEILSGGPRAWIGGGLVLLGFAGIANGLFCLAYPVDLVFQATPLRDFWANSRWILFVSGLVVASTLALWVMLGTGMA